VLSARTFTGKDEETIDDPDQISDAIKQPESLVWVDVQDPSDEDYDWIEQELSLHPLAMRDARKHGQRPKLDIYKTHSFLVTYSSLDDSATDLPEVDLFVGPDWLVTVRNCNAKGKTFGVDKVLERFRRTHNDELDGDEVGFLLYSVLDEIVIGYFDSVDEIEDRLEELETVIFEAAERSERTLQQELLGLRRSLLEFRRRVVPLRDVVQSILREEVPWVDDHNLLYFQDVLSHLLRVADQIDTQRELIGNAVDAHLATVANKMNVIMKKMTSWGAILICATIVTGVYGMNFANIPLLDNDFGYPFSIALMAAITVFGYLWFRKKDWL
jgi:magnesium transporter